jgi:hypothetical protein
MAHPDLQALLNDLLPVAERMLTEHGEFYPFGGSIASDGKHISVNWDHPNLKELIEKSKELIEAMVEIFRSQALGGQIRAAGICFDVQVIPPGQIEKTDAIQLALEREGGEAVNVFVPYAELPDGKFTYGELFASKRTPEFFVQPPLKA